jgi:uncharacterized membrane protein YqiK
MLSLSPLSIIAIIVAVILVGAILVAWFMKNICKALNDNGCYVATRHDRHTGRQ